jgi:adenylate cyclase
MFSAYVSPGLVDQMLDAAHDPELGGTRVEVSALFSDIEGFSRIAEELSPERLVTLMNDYLGAMTETFQAHGGTLDKYVGDAIVTMFGMPYPVEDHAAQACLSAMAMQAENALLRERLAATGDWPERVLRMRTRIGINSGEAVVGNMGSRLRFNYTMMGDSVNLAARCESVGKFYGVYTVISEATCVAARARLPDLLCRKLDRIVVQGRTRSVDIYELWDGVVPRGEIADCWARYEAALECYFAGDWQSALTGFEAAAELELRFDDGETTPSAVLAARCREFMNSGVPRDWDGAYRLPEK